MQKSAEVIVPSRTHHCGREGPNDEVGEESSFDSMRGKRFDAMSRPGSTGSASNEQPALGDARAVRATLNNFVEPPGADPVPGGVGRAVRNGRPYPIYVRFNEGCRERSEFEHALISVGATVKLLHPDFVAAEE
jgi:hypothetical protein